MKQNNKQAYQEGLELWKRKLESLAAANRLECKVCDTVGDECFAECPANNSNLCNRMRLAEREISAILFIIQGIVNDLEEAHEEAGLL